MIVTGYRIPTTDMLNIEKELHAVKNKLNTIANRIYQQLLGKEAAFLYDQATLNVLKEPECPFLDWVINELNLKIQIAKQNQLHSEYNFNVFVQVMTFDKITYLKVICFHQELLNAFKKLEAYHLSEEECQDKNNKKTILWEKIHKTYENNPVLSLNLSPVLAPKKEKIQIPSVRERSKEQARHDMTNHYLKQLSGGGNIPPYLLMPYFDMAMEMLLKSEGQSELKRRELHLMQILCKPEDILIKMFPENIKEETAKEEISEKDNVDKE